jgi:hypothetical protein
MNDKEIREKVSNLSALEGGIVYGREEAWEKLDNRLQQKNKRRIIFFSLRWVAAALLLLLVSVGIYKIYTPATYTQPVANVPVQEKSATPINTNTDTPQHIATLDTPPHPMQRTEKPKADKKEPIADTQAVAVAPLNPTPPDTLMVVAEKEQSTPVMSLVHINELGVATTTKDAVVWNGPSLDISKMNIVTVYDIEKKKTLPIPADDMAIVHRISRNYGTLPRLRGYSSEWNQPQAARTLSIRFGKRN